MRELVYRHAADHFGFSIATPSAARHRLIEFSACLFAADDARCAAAMRQVQDGASARNVK